MPTYTGKSRRTKPASKSHSTKAKHRAANVISKMDAWDGSDMEPHDPTRRESPFGADSESFLRANRYASQAATGFFGRGGYGGKNRL